LKGEIDKGREEVGLLKKEKDK